MQIVVIVVALIEPPLQRHRSLKMLIYKSRLIDNNLGKDNAEEVRCRRGMACTLPGICDLQMQPTALQFCAIIFKVKYTFCADEIQRYCTLLASTVTRNYLLRLSYSTARLDGSEQ